MRNQPTFAVRPNSIGKLARDFTPCRAVQRLAPTLSAGPAKIYGGRPSAIGSLEDRTFAAAAASPCHRCSFYITDRSDSAQSVDFREAGTQARPAPRGHPAARADVYGLEEPGLQEFVQLGAAYARARAASVGGAGSVRSSGHLFGSVCLAVVAGGQPTVGQYALFLADSKGLVLTASRAASRSSCRSPSTIAARSSCSAGT
jgi:hypothetical protein